MIVMAVSALLMINFFVFFFSSESGPAVLNLFFFVVGCRCCINLSFSLFFFVLGVGLWPVFYFC